MMKEPNLDLGDGVLGGPMAGLSAVETSVGGNFTSPSSIDRDSSWEEWNEFDVLLAAESGEISSLDSMSIDPRVLSV